MKILIKNWKKLKKLMKFIKFTNLLKNHTYGKCPINGCFFMKIIKINENDEKLIKIDEKLKILMKIDKFITMENAQ